MFGSRRRKLSSSSSSSACGPSSSSSSGVSKAWTRAALTLKRDSSVDMYYGKFMACFRHRGDHYYEDGMAMVDDEGEERAVFSEDESDDSDDDEDFFLTPPRPSTTHTPTSHHPSTALASPPRCRASVKAPPASPLKIKVYSDNEEEVDEEEGSGIIRRLSSQNLSALNGDSGSESDEEFDDASDSIEDLEKRGDRSRCSSSTASTSTMSSTESESDDDKSSEVVADEVEEDLVGLELEDDPTLSPQSSFEDGKPLRKSKSVDFSDTHYMVLIPARSDYDEDTKKDMWWSHHDFMHFRMCAYQQMSKLVAGSSRMWWEEDEEEEKC